MQPNQLPGLGGLSLPSHDPRDPRRAPLTQQPVYATHGVAAQLALQPGMQYSSGILVTSMAPQQLGMSIAFNQPGTVQQLQQQSFIQPFGGGLVAAQPTAYPQQQLLMPQQAGTVQQQQPGLQLQRLAPTQQAPQQQSIWTANLTTVGPAPSVGQQASTSLQLQPVSTPRPMSAAPAAAAPGTAVGGNANLPTHILGVPPPQGGLAQQQQQQQQQQLQQQSAQPQQQQAAGALAASPAAAPPHGASPAPLGVPPSSGANAAPIGGGGGGSSSAAGPRPMKRQAYQALQGSAAKRHQQQRGPANRTPGYRAPYSMGDDSPEMSVPGRGQPTRAFPGVVHMLADVQQYIVKIMLYMVKHNHYRPSVQTGRVDKQGYDLCKLKADFLNEYKYELDTKAIGFTKVKELVVWLMGDVVDCGVAGMTQSHVVLYPLPTVDYSHYSHLDCNKVLERVATTPELMDKLQDAKQQVEQYKASAAAALAAAKANPAAAPAGQPDGAVAAAAGAVDAPAAVATAAAAGGGALAALPQAAAPAAHMAGVPRQAAQVPGLNVPLPADELQQLQQDQGPQQLLLMYLKRRMLPLRVAARRAAVAEAWSEVYMRLDDPAKAMKGQAGDTVKRQSSTGAAAAAGAAASHEGTPAAGTPPAAAAAAGNDQEDGSLLQGLVADSEALSAATPAAAGGPAPAAKQEHDSSAVKTDAAAATANGSAQLADDEKALLQGLEQAAESTAAAEDPDAAAVANGDSQPSPAPADANKADGKPGSKSADKPVLQGNAAASAVIAEDILLRKPLLLTELWQGLAAEYPEAAQELAEAFGGIINADVLKQLVQELLADEQQPLPAKLHNLPAAAAAGVPGQEQQQGDPALLCTGADAADVAFVMQLYEQSAALLLESGVIGELLLYDTAPGGRLGLAGMLMSSWPGLTLEAVQATGCYTLEQLLHKEAIFGRLLTVTEGQGGRKVVRLVANARKDLRALLEMRMLQLVGAGLREATACCTLPALAGYRLDRCKQDFLLEYGYQLQQGHFGCQSLKHLLESFPDTSCYKVHQRNTFILHPSPIFHLRLMLRLLLQPAAAAAAGQPGGGVPAANGTADVATDGPKQAEHQDVSVGNNQQSQQIMGCSSGFSAATEIYPGPPALVASRSTALNTLAAAVQAASAAVVGMTVEVPVAKLSQLMSLYPSAPAAAAAVDGLAAAAEGVRVRVYPPVAVMQIFEAVFGYKLPVYRLGVEHFKQLLLELDGECQLAEKHILLDEPPPPANVPGVWLLVPPVVLPQQQQQAGKFQHYRHSIFNELYNKRLAQGRAQTLSGFEPVPVGSTAAYYSSSSTGSGRALIPALGGGSTGPSSNPSLNPRGYGSGDYGGGLGDGGRYNSGSGSGYTPRGSNAGPGMGGTLPGGAKIKIMAAVADLLRSKLASVPQAYDSSGGRNHAVPTHMGYCLSQLPNDLLNSTGITLNVEGLGYKNLVQLVGAMPDIATIVFSPDRMHRVFPPKPQAGGPPPAAAGAAMGGAQPPPPPRAGALGLGLGQTLNPNANPSTNPIPGLGGGGPLGLQGAGFKAGGAGGSGDMGGSLGLSASFIPMGLQQQQQQQQLGLGLQGIGGTMSGLSAMQQPGLAALQQQLQLQQQQLLLQQQQQQQQQQAAQQAAQQAQLQQQQQVARLQQSAQVVAAVAEAAGALGVAPAAVPKETLAALISAAAAASGQVGALTPEALAQATAALQAIFAGQAAATPAAAAAGAQQPASTPTAAAAAQQTLTSAPFAQPAMQGAAAAATPIKREATPPGSSMILPGLQETTTKPIPAASAATPAAGGKVADQQQQQQAGGSATAGPTVKVEGGTPQQQQQQQSNPYYQYQQQQQPQRTPHGNQYQQHQQWAHMAAPGQQQVPGLGAPHAAAQPRPPPRPAQAAASTAAAAAPATPAPQPPAGTPAGAAAAPGSSSWPAAAAAGSDPYHQQKANEQYGQWYQQQMAQQSGQHQQQPAAPAAAPGQPDQDAYAKWYAEYQKYLQDMAVYQQQMQQYQQHVQQQQHGASGWKPPMPPDPPPTVDAAAAAAKPAAAAAPAAAAGQYDYAAYQQAYQQQAAAYGQQPPAGMYPPGAYPSPYGGYPPGYPPGYGA